MAPSRRSSRPGGRVGRAAAWTAATVLLALGGLFLAAGGIVDEEFVEGRIGRGLSARDVAADVAVGAVGIRPLRLGVAIEDLRIETGTDSTPRSSEQRREGPSWLLSVPRATVSAVDLLAAIGGELSAAALRIEAPRLVMRRPAGGGSRHRSSAGDTAGSPAAASGATGDRRGLRLGRVRVVDGTFGHAGSRSSDLSGRANGVDLELRRLRLEGGRGVMPAVVRALSRVHVLSYHARDGRTLIRAEEIRADLAGGTARVHRLRLRRTGPAAPPPLRSPSEPAAEDTSAFTASEVELAGLAFLVVEGRTRVVARSLALDSLSVEVSESVVPDTSPDRGRPVTPVRRLSRTSGLSGRIDSLLVRAGRVRYTQRRPGQRGAGEIVFDRLEARAGPLPLGGRTTQGLDTVRVIARGRVARQAPAWIAASFPAGSAGFSFEARGGVTGLELTALNGMFRPIEGIHIGGGRLDSLTFLMRVREGRAEGRVEPVYDSLSLTLEDPRDGGTGLDEHLRSLVLGLRLNARNQPADGDDFRTGTIEHRVSPGETFLAFLWRALLSGLRDVAGV